MNIDWKRKLTSRKFWMGLAGAITGLVIFFTRPDKSSPEAITSLVMALGSFFAYVIGEGLADGGGTIITDIKEKTEESENGASES